MWTIIVIVKTIIAERRKISIKPILVCLLFHAQKRRARTHTLSLLRRSVSATVRLMD